MNSFATTVRDLATEAGIFLGRAAACLMAGAILLLALKFPYDSDQPISPAEAAKAREFYSTAYDPKNSGAVSPEEDRYAKMALEAAEQWHVKEQLAGLTQTFGLQHKRVLDIGSGVGYLQDVVDDYTGLDIAPTVARYYHKRFVLGSATAMPFENDTFDSIWSIWVLEHVPNPEAALVEIRRVSKDGAILFLGPQWDCNPWQADGYDARPYRDFGVPGKLIKAAIPARIILSKLSMPVIRGVRAAVWKISGQPSRFRYHRLTPNFKVYWEPDSDAVNSLDFHEMGLWFQSRGDECLSCDKKLSWLTQSGNPLIIQVRKRSLR